MARAALMGARGNSGVILSQIVRGAAEKVATPPGRLIDPELIEAALTNAADRAYASVREPAEGTMLTVIRAMADAVAERRAQWLRERLDPDAGEAEQNALLAEMLATALFAGEEAVRHTTEQLDVLAEAGVVDAGALGLVVIIRGMIAGLAGEQVQLPEIPHYAAARLDQVHHADSEYRFCTNFIVTGEGLEGDAFVGGLERLGDSVLVVGDSATLKVHVHTDDTGRGDRRCSPPPARSAHEDIADMHEQVADQRARLGPRADRGRRGDQRRRDAGDVRGARRALRRRRPDAQPVDQGPAGGDRGLRRRRGAGAAELAQRDHGRRGGGAAGGEAGRTVRRRRLPSPSRRRSRRWSSSTPTPTPRRTPSAWSAGLAGVRVGAVAPAARDDAEGRFAAATRSASPATGSSPGAAPARPWSRPSPSSPTAPRS